MTNSNPNEGDLRVWNVINPPSPANHYPVGSVEEAARLIDRLTTEQLFDDSVVSNAFGLEVFEGGEWSEWWNDEGQDINEVAYDLLEADDEL